MSLHHIWVNGDVVSVYEVSRLAPEYTDCLCVDTGTLVDMRMRYGSYNINGRWQHTPLESFPGEFRVHLLLLGVS